MEKPKIELNKEAIAQFCRKYHIQKLSLFGSVLRNDFRADSDVDVLIEFQPDTHYGFLQLYQLEQELSKLFHGHKLDLVTVNFLNHRIREQVLSQAQVQYAA